MVVSNICECVAFYEYMLLILYVQWMVYIINEQILKRRFCVSTGGFLLLTFMSSLTRIVNVILLYGIGYVTEKEVFIIILYFWNSIRITV